MHPAAEATGLHPTCRWMLSLGGIGSEERENEAESGCSSRVAEATRSKGVPVLGGCSIDAQFLVVQLRDRECRRKSVADKKQMEEEVGSLKLD